MKHQPNDLTNVLRRLVELATRTGTCSISNAADASTEILVQTGIY